jgi:tRNA modification GTPase
MLPIVSHVKSLHQPSAKPGSDTIFALSSGRPPAAIAVVRVSGPQARDSVVALAGRLPEPRRAMLVRLYNRNADKSEPLDDALVLWFPAPGSETGEDTAEFQLHGGRAVVAGVLAALAQVPGLRPAEAGEFTRRAFANGKLDLTRVEGLADLIGAETEAQRRQAMRQLHGLIGDHAEGWRKRLIEGLALAEALIDFPEEDDVPQELLALCGTIAGKLEAEIDAALRDRRGERLREGLTVAIAGPVNVGKSTILNRLAKRSVAIVSPHAGTTRDVIEVHLDLAGYPVTVLDTAGLRASDDPVEREGMRRAREGATTADLVLWVSDATMERPDPPPCELTVGTAALWNVVNKCDLAGPTVSEAGIVTETLPSWQPGSTNLRISAETGTGFDALLQALNDFAVAFLATGEAPVITRERHRSVLMSCAEALKRAQAEVSAGRLEMVAEELRLASQALGRLTGRVDVEDVLDVIFRDFCIGK